MIKIFIYGCIVFMCKDGYAKLWDWKKIDTSIDTLVFKNEKNKDSAFLFGASTSSYQVEGEGGAQVKPHNQWVRAECKEIDTGEQKKEVVFPHKSGNVCEHWERYKEDIALIKHCGLTAYDFSVSWGKVEPEKGKFNQEALKHYEDVCKELVANGIKPIVTLHFYTHPCWFEDLGGFEKEENIGHFVTFCETVFKRLQQYVSIWFTINTPSGYAIPGYYLANKPPFKADMQIAVQVLKNMLDAHVAVYKRLKEIHKDAVVGICKTVFPIEPYSSWNPLDRISCSYGRYLKDTSIYDFFTKGRMKIWIPSKAYLKHENKAAVGAVDCIGLNHFSGAYLKGGEVIARAESIKTQDPLYTIYPEGMYKVLHTVWKKMANPLNIPIYVTANGIATDSETDRDLFLRQYLYALSKAIQDGVNVRGYMYWTLLDNFEWMSGYGKQFGLYAVDFKTQKRTFRTGGQYLVDVAKKYTGGEEDSKSLLKV